MFRYKNSRTSTSLKYCGRIFLYSSFVAVSLPSVSLAQEGTAAQSAAADAERGQRFEVLEAIVVTAQRREESLQETPVSVSAFSGETLENRNIVNVQDFNAIAPNVTFGELNGFARINIRGIGNQNFFTGGDPSVAMYVDGAVIARAAAQMSAFFDLDRVEVLRGPQGTLYGRNATGGSVNLITRKPTDYFEGHLKVGYGNYDQFQVESAVSGPLAGDKLKGRLALFRQTRSGFGINEFTGAGINDVNRFYGRGHLEFDSGIHNFLLTFQYGMEDDTNYQVRVFRQANPGPAGLPTGVMLGGSVAQELRNVNSEADLKNDRETYSVTGNYRVLLGDNFTLRSITNYRDYDQDYVIDIDATEIYYADVQQIIESEQFSQEFQVTYESARLNGVAGLYYFNEEIFGDNNLGPSQPPPVGPPGDFHVSLVGNVDIEAFGAFAQGTYRVLPNLGLTAGIRYSDETRDGEGTFQGPTTVFPPVDTPRHIHDSNLSLKFGVDWNVTDEVLAYASYSEGFKSGVILVGSSDPAAEPELVTAYEVGVKGDYLDRRLRANFSGFYYDYKDLQITQLLVGANTPTVTNAATAEVFGLEAEITALLTDRFTVDLKGGYLDATFESYESRNPRVPPGAPSPLEDLSGNRLPYAPKWTGDAHVEYLIPLGALEDEIELIAMSDFIYSDRVDFSAFNEDDLAQSSNLMINASLKFQDIDRRWSVMVWAKNLTDRTTFANLTVGGGLSTNRNIYGVLTSPRTYGVTAGINF